MLGGCTRSENFQKISQARLGFAVRPPQKSCRNCPRHRLDAAASATGRAGTPRHAPPSPVPLLASKCLPTAPRVGCCSPLESAAGPPRRFSCSPPPTVPGHRLRRSWSPPEARRAASRVQVVLPTPGAPTAALLRPSTASLSPARDPVPRTSTFGCCHPPGARQRPAPLFLASKWSSQPRA